MEETSSRSLSGVLVVDDDMAAAEALADNLRLMLDCDVGYACDGAEALDKAGELHPAVIVSTSGCLVSTGWRRCASCGGCSATARRA